MKKNIFVLAIAILVLASCSQDQKLAQRFVDGCRGAKIALYVPNELIKNNLRNDTIPPELDTFPDAAKIAYLESKIKVIDKIDDTKFIDILYFSMAKELRAYGLNVEYWQSDTLPADSTHWVIDIPKIEVTEMVQDRKVGAYYYDDIVSFVVPVDVVNVAAWFNLENGFTVTTAFTDQNFTNDFDGYVDVNNDGTLYAQIYADSLDMDGFYRFASMLGKLYAGYTFDYLMNGFVDGAKEKNKIDTINKYRYNPYERYFYKTSTDKLIPAE